MNIETLNRVIIALDFPSQERTLEFLTDFKEPAYVKIGMELTYGAGLDVVRKVKDMGHQVFLDLKLHDIPNTVRGGMRSLSKLGVDMVNVHCAGGKEMMEAAIIGLEEGSKGGKRPLCIGVTQLTSITQQVMNQELAISGDLEEIVVKYGENAKAAGLDGVVCSVHESKKIHQCLGDDFLTVTPGIRLADHKAQDQKRIATPQVAKEQGSSYIVVGRSITESPDPAAMYEKIKGLFEGR